MSMKKYFELFRSIKIILVTIFFSRIGLCYYYQSKEDQNKSDNILTEDWQIILLIIISMMIIPMCVLCVICCQALYRKINTRRRTSSSSSQQQQQQQQQLWQQQQQQQQQQQSSSSQVQQLQSIQVTELVVRQNVEGIQNNGQRYPQNLRQIDIIDRLWAYSYQEHNVDEDGSCTICLDDFQINQRVVYLPCVHKYHFSCIKEWIQIKGKNATCPICLSKVSQNLQP